MSHPLIPPNPQTSSDTTLLSDDQLDAVVGGLAYSDGYSCKNCTFTCDTSTQWNAHKSSNPSHTH